MFNHRKYYCNESRHLHLKVLLRGKLWEKKTLTNFNDSNTRKKCMCHMSAFLLLTMNNLLLTIGIAGKKGATSLSAELLLHMHAWFIARTVIKTIKAEARNKKAKKRIVDTGYSGELLSWEMLFYMHLCILNPKIYWIFQFSRSH